ncbi:MAG: MarR family transcriptional regulator [Anaerolineae bacterium]|nr:MarR family transcriptional regulator [Anaerolineae bacterium]
MTGLTTHRTSSTAGQILEYLLRNGSASIKELEEAMQVTATAVRQHLTSLVAEGLVVSVQERHGVGRPRNVYKLTERAYGLFACYSDELALSLIGEVVETEGADKLRYLLSRVSAKLARQYARQLSGENLGDRVRELSAVLDRRGIRADFEHSGDVIMLREYNCPYHELASVHRDVCEMERDAFAQALGADVSLSACIHDGHTSCLFVVTDRSEVAPSSVPASRAAA